MDDQKKKEFLDENTPKEKIDLVMNDIMESKFDKELRDRYSSVLADKYDIHRGQNQIPLGRKNRTIGLFIVAILLLVGSLIYLLNSTSNSVTVDEYLNQNVLAYYEVTRGEDTQNIKDEAYLSFNKENYQSFLEAMFALPSLTNEDELFMAYADLRLGKYNKAATTFDKFLKSSSQEKKYYQEASLYYALCLKKTDRAAYKSYTKSLNTDSWVMKELEQISD